MTEALERREVPPTIDKIVFLTEPAEDGSTERIVSLEDYLATPLVDTVGEGDYALTYQRPDGSRPEGITYLDAKILDGSFISLQNAIDPGAVSLEEASALIEASKSEDAKGFARTRTGRVVVMRTIDHNIPFFNSSQAQENA